MNIHFDHTPDAQDVLAAVRQVVRLHGKPLSRPQPILESERKANTNAQTLHLLCDMLALTDERLAGFLRQYAECARLELTGPGDDLRGAYDDLLGAASEVAADFERAAAWLDGPEVV